MDDEDKDLLPCMIEFIDPCAYEKHTTSEVFNEASCKILQAFGLCAEFKEVYKLIYCFDLSNEEEHDGIVIPRGCVKKIVWLEEKYPIMKVTGGKN